MFKLLNRALSARRGMYRDYLAHRYSSIIASIAIIVLINGLTGLSLFSKVVLFLLSLVFCFVMDNLDEEAMTCFLPIIFPVYSIVSVLLVAFLDSTLNQHSSANDFNKSTILIGGVLFVWYIAYLLIYSFVSSEEVEDYGLLSNFVAAKVSQQEYKKTTGTDYLSLKTMRTLAKHNPKTTQSLVYNKELNQHLTDEDLVSLVQLSETYSKLNKNASNYRKMKHRLDNLFKETELEQKRRKSNVEKEPDYLDELISTENESLVEMTENLFQK